MPVVVRRGAGVTLSKPGEVTLPELTWRTGLARKAACTRQCLGAPAPRSGPHTAPCTSQQPPPSAPPSALSPPRGARLNVRSPIFTKSRRGHVCSLHCTRAGQLMVYRMGSRMSGQPSCASTLESAVSTMEWMMDWGWITAPGWGAWRQEWGAQGGWTAAQAQARIPPSEYTRSIPSLRTNLNVVVVGAKQVVRLNHLQALVHQRGWGRGGGRDGRSDAHQLCLGPGSSGGAEATSAIQQQRQPLQHGQCSSACLPVCTWQPGAVALLPTPRTAPWGRSPESMVIFLPMDQLGCFSASATVTAQGRAGGSERQQWQHPMPPAHVQRQQWQHSARRLVSSQAVALSCHARLHCRHATPHPPLPTHRAPASPPAGRGRRHPRRSG